MSDILHIQVKRGASEHQRFLAIREVSNLAPSPEEEALRFVEKVSNGMEREIIIYNGDCYDSIEEAIESREMDTGLDSGEIKVMTYAPSPLEVQA